MVEGREHRLTQYNTAFITTTYDHQNGIPVERFHYQEKTFANCLKIRFSWKKTFANLR